MPRRRLLVTLPALALTLRGASRGGMDGPVTDEGATDFGLDSAAMVQLRMAGAFEGVISFVVGLTAPPCDRLTVLPDPKRIIIDFAHPAG